MVGRVDRTRQSDRHRQIFRRVVEHDRLVVRFHRAREHQSETGKPYGPDFPDYSLVDIVTAQRALLDALGVKHLVAVAGLSFGGYQAFQWGVTFPDAMSGIVPVVTAPNATDGARMVTDLQARFADAPG